MARRNSFTRFRIALLVVMAAATTRSARAEILGVESNSFSLTAKADRISTPDGGSVYFWGFSSDGGRPQYPGPTMIVSESTTTPVTVSVTNQLPAQFNQRVSLSISGLSGVVATCAVAPCVQGAITLEAGQGGTVTYTFLPTRPGTFLYNSASRPDLQVEMGMAGAMVVRPAGANQAYHSAGSAFDREYLFFLSEMDSRVHDMVEDQGIDAVDASGLLAHYFPNYWFINGRNAPDTMAAAGAARFPTQPYNALPRTHPGERLLMRVVGGGHDMHPFHHHGQHARILAVDANPLETTPDALDLTHEVFTIQSVPGQTVDAIYRWTGKDIGWDVYGDSNAPIHLAGSCGGGAGHTPLTSEGLDPLTAEYCGDHGKAIPVVLPENLALANGPFYSGSPYLGATALTTPGDGGMNPNAGYTYMWHSHTEKEITNFDIFPGGMMTMLIIEPPGVVIE